MIDFSSIRLEERISAQTIFEDDSRGLVTSFAKCVITRGDEGDEAVKSLQTSHLEASEATATSLTLSCNGSDSFNKNIFIILKEDVKLVHIFIGCAKFERICDEPEFVPHADPETGSLQSSSALFTREESTKARSCLHELLSTYEPCTGLGEPVKGGLKAAPLPIRRERTIEVARLRIKEA